MLSSSYVCFMSICLWSLLHHVLMEGGPGVGEEGEEDFSFDGLPGAQHEFKVEVPGNQEECFVQKVAQNAELHASFEVLRGGSRMVDFYIKDVHNRVIDELLYKSEGSFKYTVPATGHYQICVNNVHSRFVSKLVHFYIVTMVEEEWTKYVQEIDEINNTVENFTVVITEVQNSIKQVRLHQSATRMNVMKDWYMVTGNNSYVMYWSLFQIACVLMTSSFQVYFVRKLFNIPNVTPTAKPRA
uniref:Transmembrane emp24 domain-containing protein 6-like n=1 Tax=Crassostrea virginica TaxID=6565 RepID=A0A8B8EMY4_CRAVI|nr:transmembrane emp24 domain-containing protein 6-like [Crassostrea virginica]